MSGTSRAGSSQGQILVFQFQLQGHFLRKNNVNLSHNLIFKMLILFYLFVFVLADLGCLCFCSGFLWFGRVGATLHCRVWALEHSLSSCGTWAWWSGGMWDLPGPGMESVFPHWQVDSLTTGPPRSLMIIFFKCLALITFLNYLI